MSLLSIKFSESREALNYSSKLSQYVKVEDVGCNNCCSMHSNGPLVGKK